MCNPEPDHRSPGRRARDEQIAAEDRRAQLNLQPDARALPVESYLTSHLHPRAIAGIVENGVVRVLDPAIRLPERARVIIVASDEG